MNQVALCFAKTPGLTPAKTRLAKDVGKSLAEQLYHLMVERCLELMGQFTNFHPIIAVNEIQGMESHIWKGLPTYLQADGNLGIKLAHAEKTFLKSYQTICFWGTDSPSLTLKHFRAIDLALKKHSTVIIPAKDGGFILYATHLPLREGVWESITYSSSDTLNQLKRHMPQDTFYLDALSDLDTREDILPVLAEMNREGDQGAAWRNLKVFLQSL